MKKPLEKLVSYISLWCGACNDKSPYQFTLVFDYDNEKQQNYFYFESENDMLHAKKYLQDNGCFVRIYPNRKNAEISECIF